MRTLGRTVVVAVALVSGRAAAEPLPTFDLSRCPIFEDAAARRAIAGELTIPVEERAKLAQVGVVVACPDAITARIVVTPSPPDGALEKTLDLGDLPEDMRLRLVALAVAELVAVAVGVVPDAAPAPPVAPPAPKRGAHVGEGGLDARPLGDDRAPPGLLPARVDRPAPLRRRRALLGRGEAAPVAFARAGVRVYTDRAAPMLDVAVGGARGPLALDVFVATRSTTDRLGTMRGTVGGVGATLTIGCRGGQGTWVCGGARVAGGVAAVTTDAAHPMIVSGDLYAPYGEAGPRLDIRLEHARWSGDLSVIGGWSAGVAALADDREIVRLSGPFVLLGLTLGWSP